MSAEQCGLFRSFWMGGFECSCHINHSGRLDMTAGTQHDVLAETDYSLLRSQGMQTARDGVRWHLIDKGNGTYDFSSFTPMLGAALRQGTQIIWDLCHYGWPDGLDIFSPAFIDRFAQFSAAVARCIREHTDEVPFFSPINEISFFSWGATRGFMFPYAEGRDRELKNQLVRAVIASVEAVRGVDARARVTFPEPVIHVLGDNISKQAWAEGYTRSQFEAWDMIGGFLNPELGGKPEYLDIIGCNFYATNQWEVASAKRLEWDSGPQDPRWRPLRLLLRDVWQRYRRPVYLAETSHIGHGRADWIVEIAEEVRLARDYGIPVEGICLYPILDRYDWGNTDHWHNSGLWDLTPNACGGWDRVLNQHYAEGLRFARTIVNNCGARAERKNPNRSLLPSSNLA